MTNIEMKMKAHWLNYDVLLRLAFSQPTARGRCFQNISDDVYSATDGCRSEKEKGDEAFTAKVTYGQGQKRFQIRARES